MGGNNYGKILLPDGSVGEIIGIDTNIAGRLCVRSPTFRGWCILQDDGEVTEDNLLAYDPDFKPPKLPVKK